MIRIDARTVELTDRELAATDLHGALLDRGYGIHHATDGVRLVYRDTLNGAFYEWLSD